MTVDEFHCPFCASDAVTRVGQWGGQMITAHWQCLVCKSYFEAIREDFADDHQPSAPHAAGADREVGWPISTNGETKPCA
ncbi:hypothetical protein DSM112329_04280 [Paraconexibacter sp. AEG42_29]|uniref:PaaD zinc beta ribbon domain-containing protein n=1 Tax=Paraconexibacter sp. AEG42_29 TaxID=2997339 RepID=A0AAU7B1E7_9ACTN